MDRRNGVSIETPTFYLALLLCGSANKLFEVPGFERLYSTDYAGLLFRMDTGNFTALDADASHQSFLVEYKRINA